MIDVVMTCYFPADAPARQQYARMAVDSLSRQGLEHSEKLRLILADDTESPEPHEPFICGLERLVQDRQWASIHTCSYHHGIGASLNTALEQVQDLWMYTTDDWLLTAELDLDGPAYLLRQGYDVVRLGPVHPDLQCVTRFQAGLGWWLDLNQQYGGFAFATRPFLATKDWYLRMGPFDEGLNSYETERLYAERVAHSTSKLAYWGGVDLAGPWEHIGTVNVGYREVV